MSNPWFRLYSRIMTDPEIEFLSFEDQRHFVWLLCLKNEGILDKKYKTPEMRDKVIARKLGLQGEAWDNFKSRMCNTGLVTSTLQPRKWNDLQFKSDSSKERVRAYRERKKQENEQRNGNGDCNVTVTPQDTDTEQNNNTTSDGDKNDYKTLINQILDSWENHLPNNPQVIKSRLPGSARHKQLLARINENPDHQKPEFWDWLFAYLGKSPHHTGQNDRGWQADFAWIVNRSNFDKILEKALNDSRR